MQMQILLTAFILGLAAPIQPASGATESGLRAVYDVTRFEENPAAQTAPKSGVENVVLTARLTPTALALRHGDFEQILEFTAGYVTQLDHAQRSSYRYSLLAMPAFKELELRNRAMMTRLHKALDLNGGDLVDAEAELSMLGDPPAKLKMKEQSRGETRVFVLNNREMVTFVPDAIELPAALGRALNRLYLFGAQIHPKVRAALTASASLPAQLTYGFRLFDSRRTATWQLRDSILEDMDLAAAAAQYPVGPVGDGPVLQAAWRVRSGQAGPPRTVTDYETRIEKLLAEGRGFEAFLVGMETGFATNHTPEPLLKQARQTAGSDPQMGAYLRSIEIESSHGDAKQALAVLEPLDAAALEGGPAIHVQRANQYIRLGNGAKTLEEFGHALAQNPFMFGPLHDSGWLYYNDYAMDRAWSCWEAARAIAPGDREMKDVADMEAALRRKHPEFF